MSSLSVKLTVVAVVSMPLMVEEAVFVRAGYATGVTVYASDSAISKGLELSCTSNSLRDYSNMTSSRGGDAADRLWTSVSGPPIPAKIFRASNKLVFTSVPTL